MLFLDFLYNRHDISWAFSISFKSHERLDIAQKNSSQHKYVFDDARSNCLDLQKFLHS